LYLYFRGVEGVPGINEMTGTAQAGNTAWVFERSNYKESQKT